jgi:opacity protein-like surface antigen
MTKLRVCVSKAILLGAAVAAFGMAAQAQDASPVTNIVTVAPPATPAAAPDPMPARNFLSKVDLFVGYSYLDNGLARAGGGDCFICASRVGTNGGILSITYNMNDHFGLTIEGSTNQGIGTETETDTDFVKTYVESTSFLIGPTVSTRVGKVKLFAHVLPGLTRAESKITDGFGSTVEDVQRIPLNTGFAVALGGGADWNLTKHFSWRVIQADFIWNDLKTGRADESFGDIVSVNNVRVGTGVVWSWGERQ